jgi:hypothetical protein
MLHGVDCNLELHVFERVVRPDGLEGAFQVVGRGIGGECLDDAAWGCLLEVGAYADEVLLPSGEKGDGHVAVLGVGEDAGYAYALFNCKYCFLRRLKSKPSYILILYHCIMST